MQNAYIIQGPTIYTESGVLKNHAMLVRENKIESFVEASKIPANLPVHKFPKDSHLIPGMIDMHIHGAKGADVMDGTVESLDIISAALYQEGVSGYLATTMTQTSENIEQALKTVREVMTRPLKSKHAEILGVHLEGPFLSVKHMGAQRGDLIRDPDIALFDRWQEISGGNIRMVTIAPELPNAIPFIKHLVQSGVIASIGHTDATYEQTQAGIDAGATHATHLFNAMRGIHHREPGTVSALLLDDRVAPELIVDGVHLTPAIVNLALKMKTPENIILVTDAMRAKCCGEGVFDLGGQSVTVKGAEARLTSGALAGSVLTLNQAIRNMRHFTNCSVSDLIHMVCTTPAKQLNRLNQRGTLAIGKKAEGVVLSAQLDVLRVV